MAGGTGTAPGQVAAEPNVIPMIDIMLVMLIIFMVSQPLARMAIDVQVPPQETATKSNAQSNQIVLELKDDGSYAINSQPVPKDQLDTQIHAIYDNRPAKLMFIKSAPERTYQDVIEAMDIARGAGVQVIGFTPQEAGGGGATQP
ncbi:MAG TPA: biopolymer transporter ExbD [Gemmatimonadales bacterium]|nr:biopolymer transporter ExbD [Gemmatimonadales bacterium]